MKILKLFLKILKSHRKYDDNFISSQILLFSVNEGVTIKLIVVGIAYIEISVA